MRRPVFKQEVAAREQREQIEGGAGSLFVCRWLPRPLTPAGLRTRAFDPLPLPAVTHSTLREGLQTDQRDRPGVTPALG